MLETVIVVALMLAALGAGAVVISYRRFMGTRVRLIEYMRRAAPEITVRGVTDVGFTADVLGAEVDVDLASLARRRPRALQETEWFDQVIAGIRERIPLPAVPPFPLVMDRVMPLLKPADYVALFGRYPLALRLAWRPFVPGVAVTYVIIGVDQRTAVTAGMLETWGTTPETLHRLAVENLAKQTRHILAEIEGPRARYEHLDGFDATRILVTDLIVPPGVSDPVIAIPEETVLLIAPASDRAALSAEATVRYAASARRLSPAVFRPSPTGHRPVQES